MFPWTNLLSWALQDRRHCQNKNIGTSFVEWVYTDLKNHAHVKKVGHTSEFLFGIY